LNPALTVSAADLQKQFDVSRELMRMQSGVNAALGKLTTVHKDHPEEAEALMAQITRPFNMGRSRTGPRLRDNLDALFTMIDGANAAPTPAQMHYFEQLQMTYRDVMQKVDALTGDTAAISASPSH
jgi:hypothetical protein